MKERPLDRAAVLAVLDRLVTPGIKLTALADQLGLRKHDIADLREMILDLVEADLVEVRPGGALALRPRGRAADRPGERASSTPAPAVARPAIRASTRPAPSAPPPRRQRGAARDPAEVRLTSDVVDPPQPLPRAARATTPPRVAAPASSAAPVVEGRITVHPAGYGFVRSEDGVDVFIPAKYRGLSLDGDRVVVTTWPGAKGTEGRVEEIKARGRARVTGMIRRAGRAVSLEPDDPRIAADYGRVILEGPVPSAENVVVVVELTRYPSEVDRTLAGRVVRVLGEAGNPKTEIEKIIAIGAMPTEFPEAALQQAERTPQEVGPDDLADRIDLRERRFCTIDPETARDFDDALCVEAGPQGGTRVWVAVADVAHYVRWGDALDQEAVLRGVSVYLPDRVIPMLPHQLSSGVCSLNPNVDRCAMVVRLDYDADGGLVDVGYAAAAIRSKARFDYPGVAAALAGDLRGRREMYRPWLDELTALDSLAQKLRVKRRARGALDLELPEPKVVLDADDPMLVRDVVKAKGDPGVKRAYELVEEFMIAANEAVGAFFRKRGLTTVWRIHAAPDRERVETLAQMLGAFGIKVDVEEALTPVGMKRVLDEVAARPAVRALSFLVLRSLTQAVWDIVPVGHFGLASADYLHFTSPIRRYPDTLVHRLLKYYLHKEGQASGGGYRKPPPADEVLAELAARSSAHERRAMEAEREAVAMYRAYLMREQVGEQFAGTICAVTNFGAFVEIEEPYVEGLVKLDALGDEPFHYDAINMRLSGTRTGRTLALGDAVKVEVMNVSVSRRRIELSLVEGGAVVRPDASTPRGKPGRGGDRPYAKPAGRPDGRGPGRGENPYGKPGKAGKPGKPAAKPYGKPAAKPYGKPATKPYDKPGKSSKPDRTPAPPFAKPSTHPGKPGPVAPPPRNLGTVLRAGRAVERAVSDAASQRATAGRGEKGGLRLGVSHRGLAGKGKRGKGR